MPHLTAQITDDISIVDIIKILNTKKLFIAICCCIGIAIGFTLIWITPEKYVVYTSILPPKKNNLGSGAPSLSGVGGGFSLDNKNPNQIYISMLESRTVSEKVVKQFDLDKVYKKSLEKSVATLQKKNTNFTLGKDDLIQIEVKDTDATRAINIANEYPKILRALINKTSTTESAMRLEFITEQLKEAKAQLNLAEIEVQQLNEKNGGIELSTQTKVSIDQQVGLRSQITTKEIEIAAMRASVTEENQSLIALNNQLTALRNELSRQQSSKRDEDNFLVPTKQIQSRNRMMIAAVREMKFREQVVSNLTNILNAATLDDFRSIVNVTVLDTAVIPEKPAEPKKAIILLVSFMLFLLLGIGITLSQHFFKKQS